MSFSSNHACVSRSEDGKLIECTRKGKADACHHCLPFLRAAQLVPSNIQSTTMCCPNNFWKKFNQKENKNYLSVREGSLSEEEKNHVGPRCMSTHGTVYALDIS